MQRPIVNESLRYDTDDSTGTCRRTGRWREQNLAGPAATTLPAQPSGWAPPRPTPADVIRQIGAVVADIPRFAAAPLLRPWHAPTPTASTAFVVDSFQQPEWMLRRTPTSTWAWQLSPLSNDRTRLITRLRAVYDVLHPSGMLLMEFGDWPMMRRMLRGIRQRAEVDALRPIPFPIRAPAATAIAAAAQRPLSRRKRST